jgi:hypothetical protein
MDKGYAPASGFCGKPRRGLAIDGEGDRTLTFRAIDIGIAGGVDDGVPWAFCDSTRNRLSIDQIELVARRRYDVHVLHGRQLAKLRADLAAATKKEEAHASSTYFGKAAANDGLPV